MTKSIFDHDHRLKRRVHQSQAKEEALLQEEELKQELAMLRDEREELIRKANEVALDRECISLVDKLLQG